jgi:ectoine hydroxylase-related dioxygenase (phytanoyl-CoA dioxygenase family)
VVEDIFSTEEADEIFREAVDVSTEELKKAVAGNDADQSEDGTLAPRKIDSPFLNSTVFREAALNPKIGEVLEPLLGWTAFLARDQIFTRPSRFGSAKPYHKDNDNFRCSPADDVITAWIALDDVDGEKGRLRCIDGLHRLDLMPHEPIPGEPHS